MTPTDTETKLTEELNKAMKARCLGHIKDGEFVGALELIEAGKAIESGDAKAAQEWLSDYTNN
ncbi:hypothetical protein [Pseudophaeobacter sp.]|jgi:hypothetical protein|uniref:hypothetical protein n=1 Tax=Pseudophaeobacter sp. TaxID=1971739 RepID=UPI0032D94D88